MKSQLDCFGWRHFQGASTDVQSWHLPWSLSDVASALPYKTSMIGIHGKVYQKPLFMPHTMD